MNFIIEAGKHSANFLTIMLKWMWGATVGTFSVPMTLWGYNNNIYWHRIAGRTSIFSSIELIVTADAYHPGKFLTAARIRNGKHSATIPINPVYNDIKYKYSIFYKNGGWEVSVDRKVVNIEVNRHPIISFMRFPKLDNEYESKSKVTIKIERE